MYQAIKAETTFTSSEGKTYFIEECFLQEYVKNHIEDYFPGYKIYGEYYQIKDAYYSIKRSNREVDLLLKKGKSLLAVELKSKQQKAKTAIKAVDGNWRAFGQISTYLILLEAEFKDFEIKGCIVAPKINNGLKIAALANKNIELREYQIDKNSNKLKMEKIKTVLQKNTPKENKQ